MKKTQKTTKFDYKALGLLVGLELHQQLDVKSKLFCNCPNCTREDPPTTEVIRELRPTQSELGKIDQAVLFEFKKHLKFIYETYDDVVCLVEQDEEPPHALDEEALEVTLTMVQLLQGKTMDEIHVMRKIVIDGSNTGGFQRTCIVGLGGYIEDPSFGRIGIQAISLEEDAARKIDTKTDTGIIRYRLDRLGVPLIEIATDPDIYDPAIAPIVARKIGLLLRSTRKVKRGQGTIRQDLNISISEGEIIEVKGVQELDLIQTIIENEIQRQVTFVELQKELKDKKIKPDIMRTKPKDVSHLFEKSDARVIKTTLKRKEQILALPVPYFNGILGREIQSGRRIGTELADYARFHGKVSGLFHTDELPNYGITSEDVLKVRKELGCKSEDAVIIIAGNRDNAIKAFEAIQDRILFMFQGVPKETRAANPDGTTSYSRPRPGSARMYPETDVAPRVITPDLLKHIQENLPESLEEKSKKFVQVGLSPQVAQQMVTSLQLDLFESIMENYEIPASIVASTLLETWKNLKREGVPLDNLSTETVIALFAGLSTQKFAKEAIPDFLTFLANNPQTSLEKAMEKLGIAQVDKSTVLTYLQRLVSDNSELIKERQLKAIAPLMGDAMKELQGKMDGKKVNKLLRTEIEKFLAQ